MLILPQITVGKTDITQYVYFYLVVLSNILGSYLKINTDFTKRSLLKSNYDTRIGIGPGISENINFQKVFMNRSPGIQYYRKPG